LLARYTGLPVDRSVLTAGLALRRQLQARSFTIAANWYPNPYSSSTNIDFEANPFDNNAGGLNEEWEREGEKSGKRQCFANFFVLRRT